MFKKWLKKTGQVKVYDDLLKQDTEFGKQLKPNKRNKEDKEAVLDIRFNINITPGFPKPEGFFLPVIKVFKELYPRRYKITPVLGPLNSVTIIINTIRAIRAA